MKPNPYQKPPEPALHSTTFSGNSGRGTTALWGLCFGIMAALAEKFTLEPILQKPSQSPFWMMSGLSAGMMTIMGLFMWGLVEGEKDYLQRVKDSQSQKDGDEVRYPRHSPDDKRKPVLKRYAIGGSVAGLIAGWAILHAVMPNLNSNKNTAPPVQNSFSRSSAAP